MTTELRDRDTAPVLEAYGPVWQGEGPFSGQVCGFLRLAFCNLSCAWCDTDYSWDDTKWDVAGSAVAWVSTRLREFAREWPFVVLTGGEPLIHHRNTALIDGLRGATVHVETNGTIVPSRDFDQVITHYTVSPKLFRQGDPLHRRLKEAPLQFFAEAARAGRCCFKVVVSSPEEVREASRFFDEYAVPPECSWVMPEGVTADAVIDTARKLAPAISAERLNLTLRHHIIMFGNERLT